MERRRYHRPATARFISRKPYAFFVDDEPLVPVWKNIGPKGPEAIAALKRAYFDSGYEITAMLGVPFGLFKAKSVWFSKVRSPAKLVVGTLRLAGDHQDLTPFLLDPVMSMRYLGVDLMNPPTVEGWHTGLEWIDSGVCWSESTLL